MLNNEVANTDTKLGISQSYFIIINLHLSLPVGQSYIIFIIITPLGGVMVIMLASSMVDRGFKPPVGANQK
jgi:hypothetical protein